MEVPCKVFLSLALSMLGPEDSHTHLQTPPAAGMRTLPGPAVIHTCQPTPLAPGMMTVLGPGDFHTHQQTLLSADMKTLLGPGDYHTHLQTPLAPGKKAQAYGKMVLVLVCDMKAWVYGGKRVFSS